MKLIMSNLKDKTIVKSSNNNNRLRVEVQEKEEFLVETRIRKFKIAIVKSDKPLMLIKLIM
jgi:hypothetical protein